ncbi:SIS domain-containing protein [Phaeosphaeriaceae sp. SRC1lsM3a]|nr:SIS domain-containing protein [Stagonospora sp. SRC1lsM3a]
MAAALQTPALSPPSTSTCQKRKHSDVDAQPLTPPLTATDSEGARLVSRAVNVLSTAATALSQVTLLYETDAAAQEGLVRSVEVITHVNEAGGKLIICGVGKSGLVGRKMVATMKSLGIACSFMHAAEAMHGDLGDIRKNDAVLFISYSGKTAELLALLPHIPTHTPILAITSHKRAADCPLLQTHPNTVLLPAPIHELEEVSFGVCAPTTSTTVTIAIGDMLALTVAESIYEREEQRVKEVFKRNHPGGSIGVKARKIEVEVEITSDGLSTPPGL